MEQKTRDAGAATEQSELTANEREVLKRGEERWQRIGGGAHLNEWLELYPGLDIRRRMAMRLNHANKPRGYGYGETLHRLYVEAGSLRLCAANEPDQVRRDRAKTMTTLAAVLWLNEDAERITILRESLAAITPGERSRLNSPISARQRVELALKARTAAKAAAAEGAADNAEETAPKESTKEALERLKRENTELHRQILNKDEEIATLKVKDQAAWLVDLRNTHARDIWLSTQPFVSEDDTVPLTGQSRMNLLQVIAGTERVYSLANEYKIKTAFRKRLAVFQ
jgi:hypothetical protein